MSSVREKFGHMRKVSSKVSKIHPHVIDGPDTDATLRPSPDQPTMTNLQ